MADILLVAAPLDRWLPWGRAYRRWRSRRVAAGIRRLGVRCDALDASSSNVRLEPCAGYRDNAAGCPNVVAPAQSASSMLTRWRARCVASFVARLEEEVRS